MGQDNIIHIRPTSASTSSSETPDTADGLRSAVLHGLRAPLGHKSLPTTILYSERGLQLYDDITTCAPEYYLFPAEESILKNNAHNVIDVMCRRPAGTSSKGALLELGAG